MSEIQHLAYLDQVRAIIAEHGWMVQGVGADDSQPQFAYTSGLTARDLPELLVVGLPIPLMQQMLNRAAALHCGGAPFGPGAVVDVGFNVPVRVVAPYRSPGPLGIAHEIYEGRDITVLQIEWPDVLGLWQDDPDFDQRFEGLQVPPRQQFDVELPPRSERGKS